MSLTLDRSSWKRVRLGDVVHRSREQADPFEAGVDRYVAGGHIDSHSITIQRWGHPDDGQMGSTFRYVFRPGQTLFVSARPYLRKTGVVTFSGVVADKTYVLDAASENGMLREFLPFVLSSNQFVAYASAEATGSMNPRLLWGPMQRYEFDLPPLDEQQRMADLLWAIEQHGRESRALLQSLGAAEATQFAKSVGAGGWPSVPVPELVLAGPNNGKSAVANDQDTGVPTLSISAVRAGRIVGSDAIKYVDMDPAGVAQFVLEDGDFLVVRGNGNKALVARGGLVCGGLPDGCIYPDLLIRLRFDPTKMLPEFAAAQWNSPPAHEALVIKAKSTNGIWKINGKDIKSHTLIAPPIGEQERILGALNLHQSARDAVGDELGALSRLRASVLEDIFGGAE